MRVNAKTCAQARIDEGGDEHGRGRRRGEISICAVQITKKTYENISALNRLKLKPNKCDCKVCVCVRACVCVLLHTHRERETGWEEGWGGGHPPQQTPSGGGYAGAGAACASTRLVRALTSVSVRAAIC